VAWVAYDALGENHGDLCGSTALSLMTGTQRLPNCPPFIP
jgi:hypothetical protein